MKKRPWKQGRPVAPTFAGQLNLPDCFRSTAWRINSLQQFMNHADKSKFTTSQFLGALHSKERRAHISTIGNGWARTQALWSCANIHPLGQTSWSRKGHCLVRKMLEECTAQHRQRSWQKSQAAASENMNFWSTNAPSILRAESGVDFEGGIRPYVRFLIQF